MKWLWIVRMTRLQNYIYGPTLHKAKKSLLSCRIWNEATKGVKCYDIAVVVNWCSGNANDLEGGVDTTDLIVKFGEQKKEKKNNNNNKKSTFMHTDVWLLKLFHTQE